MRASIISWFSRYGITLFLVCVCLLALGLRAHLRFSDKGYIFYGDAETSAPKSDAISLSIHALNLTEGRGFGDYVHEFRMRSFIPPGHGFLLGMYYFYLGNRPDIIGWIIAIQASLIPLFAYLFSREMFGRKIGCITALLVALYPSYIRIAFSLMTEPSALFATAIALWLLARLIRDPSPSKALLSGFVFSIATLVRPSGMAFVFALSLWLLWTPSIPFKRRVITFICFALALGSLHTAWTIRNRVVHEQPGMPYSAVGVRHAWTGANPKYMPWFYSRGSWHETLWTQPYASEVDRMSRLREETKCFVQEDRTKYFFGCLWRMGLLFNEDLRRLKEDTMKLDFNGISALSSFLVWILAVMGMVVAAKSRLTTEWSDKRRVIPGWVWVSAFSFSITLGIVGAAVYGASDRYRWPLEYVLLPFAAVGISNLLLVGKRSIFAGQEQRVTLLPLQLWHKVLGGALLALLIAVALAYAGGLTRMYLHPSQKVVLAMTNSVEDVMAMLKKCGLADEFAQQTPKWITYEDNFAERAANYGALTSLKNKLVVWHGRLLYPTYSKDGLLLSSFFVINPSDTDFGGARLVLRWRGQPENSLMDTHEGDVVTVVARISYTEAPMLGPVMEGYSMIRGRFVIPDNAAEDPPGVRD